MWASPRAEPPERIREIFSFFLVVIFCCWFLGVFICLLFWVVFRYFYIVGFLFFGMGVLKNGANFIVVDFELRKVLLLRRSLEDEHEAGLWGTIGGECDCGESFEETLKREVLEEAGVEVRRFSFFKSYLNDLYFDYRVVYFYGGLVSSEIVLSEESCDYKWFGFEEVVDMNLAFGEERVLREFVEEFG